MVESCGRAKLGGAWPDFKKALKSPQVMRALGKEKSSGKAATGR
jgi:hypothetical protein